MTASQNTDIKLQEASASGDTAIAPAKIDASCRVPLLALFGGAVLWLVVGLVLSMLAIMTFHKADMFANCPYLTYGRVQPAANDALLYGFCIPAALGVMLWIFARLSQVELELPLVPIVAANIWHLGVFVGIAAILIGDSTGFTWLEFPRGSSVLLFAAFLLIAVSAVTTFGLRQNREIYPSHWFLLAALLWFPWIYTTANLFLNAWPVRGVGQAVIYWWFSNNLVFVWLALVGVGTAFYFLPKLSGRPLQSYFLALFAFWTLILIAPWCGIPQSAPVPAWLPALSAYASMLLIIPLIAIALIAVQTVRGSNVKCQGGPLCHFKFGTAAFVLAGLLLISSGCPEFSRITDFTWFGAGINQLLILGFFTIVMAGAIIELLPRIMGFGLPFPRLVRVQHWLFMLGIVLWAGSLLIGGVEQGMKLNNSSVPFADSTGAMVNFLRVGTLGLSLILVGSLFFAANIFAATLKWKFALAKTAIAYIKTPLETPEVKA